jgi:hypothetical protein
MSALMGGEEVGDVDSENEFAKLSHPGSRSMRKLIQDRFASAHES